MSSCETILPRLAPSAARIAISRLRPVARAIRRFATLAQAIRAQSSPHRAATMRGCRIAGGSLSHKGSAVKVSV